MLVVVSATVLACESSSPTGATDNNVPQTQSTTGISEGLTVTIVCFGGPGGGSASSDQVNLTGLSAGVEVSWTSGATALLTCEPPFSLTRDPDLHSLASVNVPGAAGDWHAHFTLLDEPLRLQPDCSFDGSGRTTSPLTCQIADLQDDISLSAYSAGAVNAGAMVFIR